MARGKKVNTKAKIKDINLNEQFPVDIDEQIAELEDKLDKMDKDREAKCEAAKGQLVEMIEITQDKYRTATGVAEALRVIRFVDVYNGDHVKELDIAHDLAIQMAGVCWDMSEKARSLDYNEMDKLCDGFYNKSFAGSDDDLAYEMMKIDLCRNVGGAAEDMVEFWKHVQEEIDDTCKALDELKASKEETDKARSPEED